MRSETRRQLERQENRLSPAYPPEYKSPDGTIAKLGGELTAYIDKDMVPALP
jgi:hypothetical protein